MSRRLARVSASSSITSTWRGESTAIGITLSRVGQPGHRGQELRDVKWLIADGVGALVQKLLDALIHLGPMTGHYDRAGLRIPLPHQPEHRRAVPGRQLHVDQDRL